MHIESDFSVARNLVQHMNKFHLVSGVPDADQLSPEELVSRKQEIQDFVKANTSKVLYF